MLSELMANDDTYRLDESDLARLYSPAGLDIGANASAEIAVSIIAEMRAVLDGRCGGMLRERRGSIHGRASDGAHASLIREQALTVAAA
jgi:xanthine dehydrogenase accessory factor